MAVNSASVKCFSKILNIITTNISNDICSLTPLNHRLVKISCDLSTVFPYPIFLSQNIIASLTAYTRNS